MLVASYLEFELIEIRNLKFHVWNFEFGTCILLNLEFGIWNLESSVHSLKNRRRWALLHGQT